jgi:uncharacterized protein
MEINPTVPADRQYIQRYDGDGFRVSGVDYRGAILVLPERTLVWPLVAISALELAALAPVLEAEPRPELLLIGCGRRGVPVPAGLRGALRAEGIGLETMDTGAACRTYNVLLADGRRVAAALLPPGG